MNRNALSTTLLLLAAIALAVVSSQCLDQGVGVTPTANGHPAGQWQFAVEMHAWDLDAWAREHPDAPTPGAAMWWTWAQLNPRDGVYRWDIVDDYRDKAKALGRDFHFSVLPMVDWGEDGTPAWVYVKYQNEPYRTCDDAPYPAWHEMGWKAEWHRFIGALAERYDGDPDVVSIWISTALYGETVTTQKGRACSLGEGRNPGRYFSETLDAYAGAFAETPLYMILTGSVDRWQLAQRCVELGVGIKYNGLHPDSILFGEGEEERKRNRYGLLTILDMLPDARVAWEHAHQPDAIETYWSVLVALATGADFVDWTRPQLAAMATMELIGGETVWEFAERHSRQDAGIWIARTTNHEETPWEAGYSGPYAHRIEHVGGELELVARGDADDPYAAFGHGVAKDGWLVFETDIEPPFRVVFICKMDVDPWEWVEMDWSGDGVARFDEGLIRTNGEIEIFCDQIHCVEVIPLADGTPMPEPSHTETRRPTVTATYTYTPRGTPTVTMTPLWTPTPDERLDLLERRVETLEARWDKLKGIE